MAFEPCYVWPTDVFPIAHLYSSKQLELFVLEHFTHNYNWLRKYRPRIDDRHFFIVRTPWNISDFFGQHCHDMCVDLKLPKQQIFWLFNSIPEAKRLLAWGFRGALVNNNCFVDERAFRVLYDTYAKPYRAIMVARNVAFKRHYLASKVADLALIAGGYNADPAATAALPPHVYNNDVELSANEVCRKLNDAVCGLILSAEEGACYASSEYLLSGIPVVSTESIGGRDVWYDDYNSIICESTPEAVAAAVEYFNTHRRDPYVIRARHLEQMQRYRKKFISIVQDVFDMHGVAEDAESFLMADERLYRTLHYRSTDYPALHALACAK